MRKFASVGILIMGLCVAAAAADEPRVEVFGGISYLHIDTMGLNNLGLKANYAGWDTEFQVNLNKVLGLTADIGGNYGRLVPDTPTRHTYTYVFGPTFSVRREHATIFAHTLFGENSTDIITAAGTGTSNSETAFAMAFGAGLDIKVSRVFAIRLGQLDWLYTRHNLSLVTVEGLQLKDHQNNIRYAGGVVFNFGGH
jgi:opacity protein-like surface antigen